MELVHEGKIDARSGDIRFDGDVRIEGDVENAMIVGATGKVTIAGTVQKATVEADASVIIKGNVLSSTVTVGMQEVAEEVLAKQLNGLVSYLERVNDAVLETVQIRSVQLGEITAGELKELVRVILKEEYLDFQYDKFLFIQNVKSHSSRISSEWGTVIEKLYSIFTDTSLTVVKDGEEFSKLLEEAYALVEHYSARECGSSRLDIPYAINSILSCNGTIEVTEAGLSNCSVTAEKQVTVNGCCRGGVITGGEKVSIKETGSTTGVKTVIKTNKSGTITIGLARCGTEIWIGDNVYHFDADKLGVHARMVDGQLWID